MFSFSIIHQIDLCAVLKPILTHDQQEKLAEAGGNDYQYEITATVSDSHTVTAQAISGYELMEALVFVQKALGDFNSLVVVLGSTAIQEESARFIASDDAKSRLYCLADVVCRKSA